MTAPVRNYEFQITREFSAPSTPDWTNARTHIVTPDETTGLPTEFRMPVVGGTTYAVRSRKVDVFGKASAWGTHAEHTTTAGPDSVAVTNEGATVTIDDTGLHVVDGFISIEDEFGEVTLEAGGFSASWADFITYGIYNAVFGSGIVGTVDVGRTTDLPYWTLGSVANCAIDRITSTTFPSGYRIRMDPTGFNNATMALVSDPFPVAPGVWYMPTMYYGYVLGAGGCSLDWSLGIDWYDNDDVYISSSTGIDVFITAVGGTGSAITATKTNGAILAPARARYARAYIAMEMLGGTNGGTNRMYIGGATLQEHLSNSAYLQDATITSDLFFTAGSPSKARLGGFSGGGLYVDTQSNAVDSEFLVDATSGQRGYLSIGVEGDSYRRFRAEGSATLLGIELGPGNVPRDIRIARPATKTVQVDAAGGDLDLLDLDTLIMDYGDALLRASGTSFPGSPTTSDRFYRSDYDMEFFYDGTRWLSTTLYIMQMTALEALAATGSRYGMPAVTVGTDMWLEDWTSKFFVSGGSALSGSHKWTFDLNKFDSANASTNLSSILVNSGSSSVWRTQTTAIDALLGSFFGFRTTYTKFGTPGTLYALEYLTYRIVAT